MNNLTIARKLQLMIITAVSALCVVAFTGFYGVTLVKNALQHTQNFTVPSLLSISAADSLFVKYRLSVAQHIQNTSIGENENYDKRVQDYQTSLIALLDKHEKTLVNDDNDRKMIAAEKALLKNYNERIGRVIQLSREFRKDEASEELVNDVTPIGEELEKAFKAHIAYSTEIDQKQEVATNSSSRIAVSMAMVIGLIGILAIVGIGLLIIRGISRSLKDMEKTITQIESLDFTARATHHGNDELSKMARMLNRLLGTLQDNLKSITDSARHVAQASTQMSSTAAQVAAASQQQSSAASSMAATVEEMTVSINHVGDRASEAHDISAQSGKLAASGEVTIGKTVADIREIADSVAEAANRIRELETQGNQISAIVTVIKEVADQTNLLALNAAIEAARAGEQGRGFAVVADEVRKLAERTASSTQEIAGTISSMQNIASNAVQGMENAVEKVAQGVARASDANESIQQIGSGSRRAIAMVGEITDAIREQGVATNNIAQQVEKIAQMAEESSAGSATNARAARELDQLAEKMQQIVSKYRL